MSVRVVLDTNVLVSGLWSPRGNPARIISMLPTDELVLYYDYQIMCEYQDVLARPKFKFSGDLTNSILNMIERRGYFVTAPASSIPFVDESDRKFYDVARFVGATVITGNLKHYPEEPFIKLPAEFLASFA